MGTSRSGSVGSSTRWKITRDEVKALAAAVAGIPLSIPQDKELGTKKKGGPSSPPIKGGGGMAKGGGAYSIPQSTADTMVPRSIRALGKHLVATSSADARFAPQVGDCAVKVAIDILLGLFTAATIKYRTQSETDKLFAEYGIGNSKNIATALAKALDKRYREDLIKKCKKATDSAEKARLAMQRTLIDIIAADGTPEAFITLNAGAIHAALRKTSSMKIVERFYANYLYKTMELLVSSINADISHTAERNVLDGLRVTYCDYVAKEVVKRAGEKGWRPSEIPAKADDWYDLLVETEDVHA
jgi:hypothetical protein